MGPHKMGRRIAPNKSFCRAKTLAQAELSSAEHFKDMGSRKRTGACGRSLARIKSMSEDTGVEFVD